MRTVYEKQAVKALKAMQPKKARGFRDSIAAIADDPFARHLNVDRIKGVKDAFRFRIGDWRAVYFVDRRNMELRVQTIKPRGEAYKR